MIQLYILTVKRDEDEIVAIFHNCVGKDLDAEMEKIREGLFELYGDEIEVTFELDEGNKYAKEHYPEQYQTILLIAMQHMAKFN